MAGELGAGVRRQSAGLVFGCLCPVTIGVKAAHAIL